MTEHNHLSNPSAWRDALQMRLALAIDKSMSQMSDEINFPWMNSEIRDAMARAAVEVLEAVTHYEQWLIEQGGLDKDWTP